MVESHSPIERYAKLKTAQPKVRNREAAQTLGLSEAELLFALTTYGDVQQLRGSGAEFAGLFRGLGKAGQLMIFTRNDSAVHEKFGTYKHALIEGGQVCIKHGEIDLKLDLEKCVFAFVVTERVTHKRSRLSLQFFDRYGVAVHNIYTTNHTDRGVFEHLVENWLSKEPKPLQVCKEAKDTTPLTTHRLGRQIKNGEPFIVRLLERIAELGIHVRMEVQSGGCAQVHDGPLKTIKVTTLWINVFDKKFHMHLRSDHIAKLQLVIPENADDGKSELQIFNPFGRLVFQMTASRMHSGSLANTWHQLIEEQLQGEFQ